MAKMYRVEGLEADSEHVNEGTVHMFQEFQKVMEEKQWSIIDAFMIAHSFHKMVVLSVMARWSLDGFEPQKTLHLADMTWRNAIQSLLKNVKAPAASAAPAQPQQIQRDDYRSVVLGSPKAKDRT